MQLTSRLAVVLVYYLQHLLSAVRLRTVAAWLVSLIVLLLAAPSNAQSADDLPYTLDGVRRAAAGRVSQAEVPEAERPSSQGPRDGSRALSVSSGAGAPAGTGSGNRAFTTSLGPFFSGWQRTFAAMTTPPYYAPFGYMRNGERAVGAASSLGIAVATNQVARLIRRAVLFMRSRTAREARREVDAELAALPGR